MNLYNLLKINIYIHQSFKSAQILVNMSDSAQQPAATKLNQVQLHLMELFSHPMSEQELLDIKELLVRYYSQKAEVELDKVWQEKGFTPESFREKTKNLHLRSQKKR